MPTPSVSEPRRHACRRWPTTCPYISSPLAADLEAWLEDNHDSSPGIWLKIAKKGSGVESVDYAEALELALCFGWIDSQKRGLDESFFLQRFTPRRPRGKWSQINRDQGAGADRRRVRCAPRAWPRSRRQKRMAAGTPPTLASARPRSPMTCSHELDRSPAAREFFASARCRQPLRDPLQVAGGEETRDPRAQAAEVHRHAGARGEDPWLSAAVSVDVAIVGAGLSGLRAARVLADAGRRGDRARGPPAGRRAPARRLAW